MSDSRVEDTYDIVIIGGGLAGLLTAWRCAVVNPNFKIALFEKTSEIGGDHTWSFNLSDIEAKYHDWIRPFIAHQWDKYSVKFPNRVRTLDIPYCSGNSETLRACVAPFIASGNIEVFENCDIDTDAVLSLPGTIRTGDTEITGSVFIDARGFKPNPDYILGYQKFVGWVIKTEKPHGLTDPIIMDATVEQFDGYRFVYCLPYSSDEILVEDTYYADGGDLAEAQISARIEAYIKKSGWTVKQILRKESGVLPITLAVKNAVTRTQDGIPKIGIRGGFFHAVTGYSFPFAVTIAVTIADYITAEPRPDLSDSVAEMISEERQRHLNRERFFRLLNRMFYKAAEPEKRYKVLERFYGLSEPLIKRFYAGNPTVFDKIRILSGKPPVPIAKAVNNFSEAAFIRRQTDSGRNNEA